MAAAASGERPGNLAARSWRICQTGEARGLSAVGRLAGDVPRTNHLGSRSRWLSRRDGQWSALPKSWSASIPSARSFSRRFWRTYLWDAAITEARQEDTESMQPVQCQACRYDLRLRSAPSVSHPKRPLVAAEGRCRLMSIRFVHACNEFNVARSFGPRSNHAQRGLKLRATSDTRIDFGSGCRDGNLSRLAPFWRVAKLTDICTNRKSTFCVTTRAVQIADRFPRRGARSKNVRCLERLPCER